MRPEADIDSENVAILDTSSHRFTLKDLPR